MVDKTYVLGFAFNSLNQVLLIKKTHPDWQAGKLNGLGGKKEKNERSYEAMVREFKEECGLKTNPGQWRHFADMYCANRWKVYCMAAVVENINEYKQTEEEKPFLVHVSELDKYYTLSNVPWLIQMAIDHLNSNFRFTAEIEYE